MQDTTAFEALIRGSIKDKGLADKLITEHKATLEASEARQAEAVKKATSPHVHNAVVTQDGNDLVVRINTKGDVISAISRKGDTWDRLAVNVGGNSMPVQVADKSWSLSVGLYRKAASVTKK